MNRVGALIYKRLLKTEKKIRMVISTLVMGGLVLLSTFFFFDKIYYFLFIFIIFGYFFTYFSILVDIERIEWLMLFFMPVVFTIAWYLFFFLFPVRWLTRLPFIILYGVSIYALLRVSNIFNVGGEKNLQLYRAAFSVNYFFQTVIVFFLANFVLSQKFGPTTNGLVFFAVSFIFSLNIFWSIRLRLNIDREIVKYSLMMGLIIGEGAVALSFFSFETAVLALLITACYYSLVGLSYLYIDERFFKETIREYLIVLVVVSAISALTLIRW